jgi:hypothetical protein
MIMSGGVAVPYAKKETANYPVALMLDKLLNLTEAYEATLSDKRNKLNPFSSKGEDVVSDLKDILKKCIKAANDLHPEVTSDKKHSLKNG